MSEKIESIGTLWKREKLATLEWEVSFNELLLEAKDPWPGYYDHFEIPSQEQDLLPRWIFAILSGAGGCDQDKIINVTARIKENFNQPFDAVPGQITLANELMECIRIQVEDYNILPELLKLYKKYGIDFAPHRKVPVYESLIKITKYFELTRLEEHIYKDNDIHDTYYIIIPDRVDWPAFETITERVKNNSDHQVFDAASASTYDKHGMIYMVRIYDRKTNMEILSHIRNKYRSEVERLAL